MLAAVRHFPDRTRDTETLAEVSERFFTCATNSSSLRHRCSQAPDAAFAHRDERNRRETASRQVDPGRRRAQRNHLGRSAGSSGRPRAERASSGAAGRGVRQFFKGPSAAVAMFAKDGPSVKVEVAMLKSPRPPAVASTSMSLCSKAKFRLMPTGRPLSSSTSLSCHVRRCPLRAPPDPNYLPLLPY